MLIQCQFCGNLVHLLLDVPYRCPCGAVYRVGTMTSNTTVPLFPLPEQYHGAYDTLKRFVDKYAVPAKPAIPKAFLDAFRDEELTHGL